ncbi:MAG TPA: hypothetical protein VFE47_03645 [Tepidisphaeraceae bacterium]|jgi:hypothetical protein|nr:hypothetical protein [Tepidisphaeraceae bacterium]
MVKSKYHHRTRRRIPFAVVIEIALLGALGWLVATSFQREHGIELSTRYYAYGGRFTRGQVHLTRTPLMKWQQKHHSHFRITGEEAPSDSFSPRFNYFGGDYSYNETGRHTFAGVQFINTSKAVNDDLWTTWPFQAIIIPLWLITLLAVPLPMVMTAGALRRWRRRRAGRCVNCGYSMTGNVSGACPECGTAPACWSSK